RNFSPRRTDSSTSRLTPSGGGVGASSASVTASPARAATGSEVQTRSDASPSRNSSPTDPFPDMRLDLRQPGNEVKAYGWCPGKQRKNRRRRRLSIRIRRALIYAVSGKLAGSARRLGKMAIRFGAAAIVAMIAKRSGRKDSHAVSQGIHAAG